MSQETRSLQELQEEFGARVQKGEFVEVMEDFYADEVFQVEGNGERREGKAAIINFEKEFLTQVAAFNGVEVRSLAVASDDGQGNGTTLAEYSIDADLKGGKGFKPEQVQVSQWSKGKIVAIRYYYAPSF